MVRKLKPKAKNSEVERAELIVNFPRKSFKQIIEELEETRHTALFIDYLSSQAKINKMPFFEYLRLKFKELDEKITMPTSYHETNQVPVQKIFFNG
jgi:DNA primase large subunit